jgi:hypothetical protein
MVGLFNWYLKFKSSEVGAECFALHVRSQERPGNANNLYCNVIKLSFFSLPPFFSSVFPHTSQLSARLYVSPPPINFEPVAGFRKATTVFWGVASCGLYCVTDVLEVPTTYVTRATMTLDTVVAFETIVALLTSTPAAWCKEHFGF